MKVDPDKIENSESEKLSGVTIDSHSIDSQLSFNKHINNICSKTKAIMNINNFS